MSNSHKRDYAPGKTKGTGKLGSFCQGFTESDCDKAKSACQWIVKEKTKPFCQRSIKKHDMNALSKFNANKKPKLSAKIVIALSMYHANGDKMTTEEVQDITDPAQNGRFAWVVAEAILEGFGEYDPSDIQHRLSAVDNFILVKTPISVEYSGYLDINVIIEELQEHLDHLVRKHPFEIDDDVFIKSMSIIQID